MPVILATQKADIRRILGSNSAWASSSQDPILKNPLQKNKKPKPKRLMEALSSNSSTEKKKSMDFPYTLHMGSLRLVFYPTTY
jgi:hypothetical protein